MKDKRSERRGGLALGYWYGIINLCQPRDKKQVNISSVGSVGRRCIVTPTSLKEENIVQGSVGAKTILGKKEWEGKSTGIGMVEKCTYKVIFTLKQLIIQTRIVHKELQNIGLSWKNTWEDILQRMRKYIIETGLRMTIDYQTLR